MGYVGGVRVLVRSYAEDLRVLNRVCQGQVCMALIIERQGVRDRYVGYAEVG